MKRLAAALFELNARHRGIDADKLGIDPTDPRVLMGGASFTMDTDAGPLDFLKDVPGRRMLVASLCGWLVTKTSFG